MIRSGEIRVLDEEKQPLGVMTAADALSLARQKGLDLVEIAPTAQPPVCRIMDYGKFLYELHKRDHEARSTRRRSRSRKSSSGRRSASTTMPSR